MTKFDYQKEAFQSILANGSSKIFAIYSIFSIVFLGQFFLGNTFDIFHVFSALHNVLFVQCDNPVAATLIPDVDRAMLCRILPI